MVNPQFKSRPLSSDNSPEQQLLLVRLIEECGELVQCATKMLRFGPASFSPFDVKKETNIVALRRERDDLYSVLEELGER